MEREEFEKLSKEEKLRVPMSEIPKPKNKNKGCAVLIGLVAFFVIIGYMCDGGGSSKNTDGSIDSASVQNAAIVEARMNIENNLKSPSSADFPLGSTIAKIMGDSLVRVNGIVDAQNSYGAMIRAKFNVVVKFEKGYTDTDSLSIIYSKIVE